MKQRQPGIPKGKPDLSPPQEEPEWLTCSTAHLTPEQRTWPVVRMGCPPIPKELDAELADIKASFRETNLRVVLLLRAGTAPEEIAKRLRVPVATVADMVHQVCDTLKRLSPQVDAIASRLATNGQVAADEPTICQQAAPPAN